LAELQAQRTSSINTVRTWPERDLHPLVDP
jgi:hypothetical protein